MRFVGFLMSSMLHGRSILELTLSTPPRPFPLCRTPFHSVAILSTPLHPFPLRSIPFHFQVDVPLLLSPPSLFLVSFHVKCST